MMRTIAIAVLSLSLVACGGDYGNEKSPEIVSKLQAIQPGADLEVVEASMGEAVSFTISKDKKSHCKAYQYKDGATSNDRYAIVWYEMNKVVKFEPDHGNTSCNPTTNKE